MRDDGKWGETLTLLVRRASFVLCGSLLLGTVGPQAHGAYLMPTAQIVQSSGRALALFGRPTDLALSPDGALLAVKTSHGITFVDRRSWRIVQTLAMPDLGIDFPRHLGGNGPAGIVWSRNGEEVWNTDEFGWVLGARRSPGGPFEWSDRIALPARAGGYSAPIGVTWSSQPNVLFVALSRDNAIVAVDLARRGIAYEIPVGNAPYGSVRVGNTLYVTNWAGRPVSGGAPSADSSGTVIRVSARTGAASSGTVSIVDLMTRRDVAQIDVGLHPSAIVASPDGSRVFVANSASDSISIVDTRSRTVVKTVVLDGSSSFGASPTALAVDASGGLWVAESGSNRVVLLDHAGRIVRSIGTLWYPSALDVLGSNLYVADLKGYGSRAVDFGLPFPPSLLPLRKSAERGAFYAYDYAGAVEAIEPSSGPGSSGGFLATGRSRSLRGLFKHVVYIIAENHTYDDFFGDLPQGNGDPRLCQFCGNVSPNRHALANRFGLFDNFYVSSILSADGHNWTDQAYASDYVERSMGGWARSYPSAGNDALAYSPQGFIWNRALDAGLTFRDYGEFVPDIDRFYPSNATWLQLYSDYRRGSHSIRWDQRVDIAALAPYVQRDYPSFSLRISDQYRASIFLRDLATFEQKGSMPNLIVMALGNDHGSGDDPGRPTPRAYAADNDLALGRIVAALSRSRFWRDTVIFVVEDDCQNGFDHVDGHRTTALVVSARNRVGAVYDEFFNQTSILHTIESIFGLPAMTEFDAHAPVIWQPFTGSPTLRPYDALPNGVRLDELNPGTRLSSASQHEHRDEF